MTDIVERLRNRALAATIIKGSPALYNDAADVIISLCAENEKFYKQAEMNARLLTENASLRAENETLRRDVKTAVMGDSAELQDVKRENEKLREALKPFADAVTDEYSWKYDVNSDDFRAARKALGET